MNTDKSDSTHSVAKKSGNASEEEPQQESAFERMIQRGLGDSDAGRILSNTAMRDQITSWHG